MDHCAWSLRAYEGEELGRGVNGVLVEILVGKHGSRPKSLMNRLQCQVKELNFISEIISKFYTLKYVENE